MNQSVSRRRFLALSSAAALGATWFDVPRILQAADDAFGGFPIGVQSYSLREFNFLEAVRHIQGLGVHYTEFFGKHLAVTATADEIASTLKVLSEAKIKLIAHGVNGFTKDHEANRKVFAFAKQAGIRNLTADPTPDSFDSLEKLVAEYDVRIAIHNHGPGHRYDKLEQVVQAVKGRHPLIGVCVDTGHVIRTKEDPIKWTRELGPRVFAMHLKDDIKQDGGSQNVVIGKGNLDVVGVFKALKSVKFPADGDLSLEYEANPKNPVEEMRQCIAVAKEAIAKAVS
ncbi:MAG: sugar phosphate isomerase/epimerase family protein [Planctomycetota bacterium]